MHPWIAIVGARQHGRTDVTFQLRDALASAGLRLGGFLQRRVLDDRAAAEGGRARDRVLGYDVVQAGGGAVTRLASHGPDPQICDWHFCEQAFETARRWTVERAFDVSFVSVGRLEAASGGHWPTLLESLERTPLTVVSIRPAARATGALRLPDPVDSIELPESPDHIARFVARVGESARERRCA